MRYCALDSYKPRLSLTGGIVISAEGVRLPHWLT